MLLDGKPVTEFTFANSTFRTTSPIAWTTPSGETAQVIHPTIVTDSYPDSENILRHRAACFLLFVMQIVRQRFTECTQAFIKPKNTHAGNRGQNASK